MENNSSTKHFFSALFFLLLVFVMQQVSSAFVEISIDPWYIELKKPNINPPGWFFQIVWPILYVIIALVGHTFWNQPKSRERTLGLTFWALQILFNTLWPFFFFSQKSPILGFIDLLVVIIFSLYVIYYGKKLRSSWIVYGFSAYVLWLIYAAIVNLSIILLN
ncbi:MAG: TspO/MBR family protein [Chlamydiota bacterium]